MAKELTKKRHFFRELIAVISWITVLLLWLSAISVYVDPQIFCYFSLLGLAFPFFLGSVLLMFIICFLFAKRKIWIPVLGLLTSFFSIRTYCPFNLSEEIPQDCYKFMSYNTLAFGTGAYGADSKECKRMSDFIVQSCPDFFCFQEGLSMPERYLKDSIYSRVQDFMPYQDTIKIKDNLLGCCSKYPIIRKELLCSNSMNGAAIFFIQLPGDDTLKIINCHLMSMGLSSDEREQYHQIVKHLEEIRKTEQPCRLAGKIARASVVRAQQADIVANYIECHQGDNFIVCGDFNDTPISYTHHRIAATGLIDAFREAGNGIGRSFNRDAIFVRIDHLFCSDEWQPYSCSIDKSIQVSDHYPIVCYLQRK